MLNLKRIYPRRRDKAWQISGFAPLTSTLSESVVSFIRTQPEMVNYPWSGPNRQQYTPLPDWNANNVTSCHIIARDWTACNFAFLSLLDFQACFFFSLLSLCPAERTDGIVWSYCQSWKILPTSQAYKGRHNIYSKTQLWCLAESALKIIRHCMDCGDKIARGPDRIACHLELFRSFSSATELPGRFQTS